MLYNMYYSKEECEEMARNIVFSNEHGVGLAKTTAQQCVRVAWFEIAEQLQHIQSNTLDLYILMYNDTKHNGGIDVSGYIDFLSFVSVARECYKLIKEQIRLLNRTGKCNENLTDYLKVAFKRASERKLINNYEGDI